MNTRGNHLWTVRRGLALAGALAMLLAAAAHAQEPKGPARSSSPAPAPAAAEHPQFPPDHPAFRFDLPAGWTVDHGSGDQSILVCNVKGHADIGLVCVAVPQIFSLDDFKNILPGLAQDQLERQGLSDLEVVSQGNERDGACPSYFVIAKGKLKQRSMSVTFLGLVSAGGRGYVLEYAVPAADGPAHLKDFQTILTSLVPVK